MISQLPMKSTLLTVVSFIVFLIVNSLNSEIAHKSTIIGLIAPFEGRYQDVGYNALYATQLAIEEANLSDQIQLLPLDIGTNISDMSQRLNAINNNQGIIAVVIIDYENQTIPELDFNAEVPIIAMGEWAITTNSPPFLIYRNPTIQDRLSDSSLQSVIAGSISDSFTGGEVITIDEFKIFIENIENVTIVSSTQLPSNEFRESYLELNQFAPEPTLVATLTYDVINIILDAVSSAKNLSRSALSSTLHQLVTDDGYFNNVSILEYQYVDGELMIVDHVIE